MARQGGSYKTDRNKETIQKRKPTSDHPMGNRARTPDQQNDPLKPVKKKVAKKKAVKKMPVKQSGA